MKKQFFFQDKFYGIIQLFNFLYQKLPNLSVPELSYNSLWYSVLYM